MLAVIVGLALVLRAGVYLEAPGPFEGSGLVAVQGEMARNIVDHGRWFVVNPKAAVLVKARQDRERKLIDPAHFDFTRVDQRASYQPEVHEMPGVAVVLAGLWWIAGRNTYSPIQWLQIFLDAGMAAVLYWATRRLRASIGAALFASLLYAVWPGAIVVAKRPMLDTWATFFVIACLAAFLLARGRPENLWPLVLLGAVTGIGIYFRPFIVLLPIVLALVATPAGGWRRRVKWFAVPTVIALLLLSPWTLRNYYEFHRFIPTRTGLGEAVFEGLGQTGSDSGAAAYVHQHRPRLKGRSPAADDFLLRRAARVIAAHPRHYLAVVGHRSRLLFPCLLVLLVWRRRKTEGLMLAAVAIAVIGPYLLIGDDTRFYLPAAFSYFILFALAADVCLSQLRRRISPPRIVPRNEVGATRQMRERI